MTVVCPGRRELVVTMGTLDNLDRASPDPPVSRVCPEVRGPLEQMVGMETRVFPVPRGIPVTPE